MSLDAVNVFYGVNYILLIFNTKTTITVILIAEK